MDHRTSIFRERRAGFPRLMCSAREVGRTWILRSRQRPQAEIQAFCRHRPLRKVRLRSVGPDDWLYVRRLPGLVPTRSSPSSRNAGASLEGPVSFLEPPSGENSPVAGVRASRHSKRNRIRAWRRNTSGRRVVRSDQNSTLARLSTSPHVRARLGNRPCRRHDHHPRNRKCAQRFDGPTDKSCLSQQ